MSYTTGTILRAYNADKTLHNTAIVLREGGVMELKNVDHRKTRTKHASVDEWKSACSFPEGSIMVDSSKAFGAVIGADTHGFKIPRGYDMKHNWFYWCYSILVEGLPLLLTNQPIITAFNDLYDICEELKFNCDSYSSNSTYRRYSSVRFTFNSDKLANGFPGYIPNVSSRSYTSDNTKYKQIGEKWKVLYDLLADPFISYLKHKFEESQKLYKINEIQKSIRRCEKKIKEYEATLKGWKDWKEKLTKQLADLEK